MARSKLHPLLPLALRIGAVAAAGYALQRMSRAKLPAGRLDLRAEDALDELPEGLSSHHPRSLQGQHNLAWRIERQVRIGHKTYAVEGAAYARFRLREID